MKTSKLSVRLLWFITPLVILPLLFLGGFTLTNVTSSTQKQAKLIVSRFVEQQQQKMFNYIEVYQSTSKLLSTSPVLSDYLAIDSRQEQQKTQQLGALMDVFASYSEAYPDIISINLLTPDGSSDAFYSSVLGQAPSRYPFTEQVLNSNLRQHQFMIPTSSGTQLYFVQQVFGVDFNLKQPRQRGYVVVQVSPSLLSTSILEAPYDNTLNLLVSNSGEVLFSSNNQLIGSYLSASEVDEISQIADLGQLQSMVINSIDDSERMTYSAQLSGGYYYISTIPKSLLYRSGKTISLITALIVILSIVTLPIMIFIVVRNLLLNPIELLGEASHRVGEGDLMVALPQHNNDEVGVLFKDFNLMVEKIRTFQRELEDYKAHLEEKVDNRTRALEETNQQLERAIVEAEQANQLKSRFLANMSHEIRTPLTAIMGFTEQLIEHPDSNNAKQHLNTILRNSKHLLELINNILDLSKIEAEKLKVEEKAVALLPLVNDIESIIEPMTNDKLLTFSTEFELPLPDTLYTDVTRLKQILLNIGTNAVKFTEYGGVHLHVAFDQQREMFIFSIKDTGIGMSEGEIRRVFKPFEQADATTTRRFGGTGLGLCISKNLAQLLGGDVLVDSQQGAGSLFKVEVAGHFAGRNVNWLNTLQQAQQQVAPPNQLSATAIDAHVLVAEDNPDNQELITLLLSNWGIVPDIVNNGAEAVEKALVNDYQLILMDMQMPVMGGEEATQMLRHAAFDGPIIALTANVMKHDIDNYLAAGCDATLGKPIDRAQLEHLLVTYLELQNDKASAWDTLLQSEKFQQISDNYMAKLPAQLEQLQRLYDTQEWDELRALAHSIKGSSGCFGFMNIHEAAGELESSLSRSADSKKHYYLLKLCEAIRYTLALKNAETIQ